MKKNTLLNTTILQMHRLALELFHKQPQLKLEENLKRKLF